MQIFIDPGTTSTQMLNFPSICVLSTQKLDNMSKLNINSHADVIIVTSNSKLGEKNLFLVIISHLLYCLHVLHLTCCVQQSNPAELPTLVHSYTTVARSESLLIAQLNYSNKYTAQCRNMPATCKECLQDGYPQQYWQSDVHGSEESDKTAPYSKGTCARSESD